MSAVLHTRVSLSLQDLANTINDALARTAGKELAFVLIVQADETAQYVSNAKRSGNEFR